jgi:hypothetical protein
MRTQASSLLNQNNLSKVTPQDSLLTGQNESVNPSVGFLLERIKKPKNSDRIVKGISLEKRVRLHTVGTQDNSTDYDNWLTRIQNLLPNDKFRIFRQLISEPVPTLDLTETIFDELAKIFEASNKSIYSSYTTDTLRKTQSFKQYFDVESFFKNEVYDMLKVAPNSILVIDSKLEVSPEGRPQPIAYFVHLESVIDMDIDRDGSTNYIIFKTSEDRIVAIDRNNYYVFDTADGQEPTLNPSYPQEHGLLDELGRPFTPAFLVYPDFLNVTDNIIVNSPLTKSLGNLDWLLFWSISKRYLDMYAPFPIYVSYEEDCTYVDPSGSACENGIVRIYDADDLEKPAGTIPCPHCSKTKMFGAGSEVTVPAPQSKEEPNLIDAIKVIPAEEKSLTYVTAEQERLEQKIYYSVLGKTSQPVENFSQSVAQLDLSTESRKAVLLHIKGVIEKVHKKVLYTMNKIMYGEEFIECHVDYGDNYFLTTQEQETERYKRLKDTGAPEGMLHSSLESIIQTTYKTAPATALLQQVYLEVEPYQTMSIETVMKLAYEGMIPKNRAVAKIHFTDFIEQFEAEHEALIRSVENGDFDKEAVVKMIKKQLADYASSVVEQINSQPTVSREETADLTKPSSVQKRMYRQEDETVPE